MASLAGGWTAGIAAAGGPQLTFEADEPTVTRGDALAYQVTGSTDGAVHVVSLAALDLQPHPTGPTEVENATRVFEGDASVGTGVLLENGTVVLADGRVFRDGAVVGNGTTTVDGAAIREVFVLLEMGSDGTGDGELNTSGLAAITGDLNLFAGAENDTAAVAAYEAADGGGEIHQRSFRVAEDDVSLTFTSPSEEYVAGDRITVEGEVEGESVEAVAVYASDGGDWLLVESALANVSVDDGTWSRTGVSLSDSAPLFRVAGTYLLGAVPVADADLDGDGEADARLTNEQFARAPSVEVEIEVLDAELTGGIETYGGELAVEDGEYNVSGSARGASEVAVVLVDAQGDALVKREPVDEEWRYGDDEFVLSDGNATLQEGRVVAFVLAAGPDGVFGFPGESPDSIYELVEFVRELDRREITQDQVVGLLQVATVRDRGSDDLANETEFRYTGAAVDVVAVGSDENAATGTSQLEPGASVELQGTTNLRPGRNAIDLELVSEATGSTLATASADEWERDGNWSATLDVPDDASPGRYLIRVDAGVVSVPVFVEVVGQPASPSGDEETTEEETTTESEEDETTTESEEDETTTTEEEETTAGDDEEETTMEENATAADEDATTVEETETTEDETTTESEEDETTETTTDDSATEDETTTTEEDETTTAMEDETTTTTEDETTTTTEEDEATTTETAAAEASAPADDSATTTGETTATPASNGEATTDDGSGGGLLDADVTVSPGQPGFGAGLAVLAALAAALLALRNR